MWDADADKYWKEKKKEQLWKEKIRKLKIGAFSLIVFSFCTLWLLRSDGTSNNAHNTSESRETPLTQDALRQCREVCAAKVIDECNNKCRKFQLEQPRYVHKNVFSKDNI